MPHLFPNQIVRLAYCIDRGVSTIAIAHILGMPHRDVITAIKDLQQRGILRKSGTDPSSLVYHPVTHQPITKRLTQDDYNIVLGATPSPTPRTVRVPKVFQSRVWLPRGKHRHSKRLRPYDTHRKQHPLHYAFYYRSEWSTVRLMLIPVSELYRYTRAKHPVDYPCGHGCYFGNVSGGCSKPKHWEPCTCINRKDHTNACYVELKKITKP